MPLTVLATAMDDSLFYLNSRSNCIEFLTPSILFGLMKRLSLDVDYRHMSILAATLVGFPGGSPGYANEMLIAKYIHKFFDLQTPTSDDCSKVKFGGRVTTRLPEYTASMATEDLEGPGKAITLEWNCGRCVSNVQELAGFLLEWQFGTAETGIDRVWLVECSEAEQGAGSSFAVHGCQFKTGKSVKAMTAGKVDTQRGYLLASSCDDTTIAGILAKASHGFAKLLIGLSLAFPNISFRCGELHVFTTKDASKALQSYHSQNGSNATFKFPDHIGEKVTYFFKERFAATLHTTFSFNINHGTGWLVDMLPKDLSILLPSSR